MPTPRALDLRDRISQLVQDAEAVLRPAERLDLTTLVRTFTLRTSEGFVENFGPPLLARLSAEAPGVRLRFVQKSQKNSAPLREGSVELETGVVDKTTAQELRVQALFNDRYIGVVRAGHALTKHRITPSRYAAGKHICVSREGLENGPIDEALAAFGLERELATIVGGFATALAPLTSSPPFQNDIPGSCEPACLALPSRSPRRSLRCRCFGIHGWIAISPIAGYAAACGKSVRSPWPARGVRARKKGSDIIRALEFGGGEGS